MKKTIIAFELKNNFIRVLKAEIRNNGISILKADKISSDSQEKLLSLFKEYVSGSGAELVTYLPRASVFFKNLTLPPGSDEEILKFLAFEAEKHLPFPADSAVIDFYPPKGISGSDQNQLYLIALKKDSAEKIYGQYKTAGINVDSIGVSTIALSGIFNIPGINALLNVSDDGWEIAVFKDNEIAVSRGFAITPESGIDLLKHEIQNTFSIFYASNRETKIENIYYISSGNQSLISELTNILPVKPIELDLDFAKHNISLAPGVDTELTTEFSILIGLLLPSKRAINLLPEYIKSENKRIIFKRAAFKSIAFLILGIVILSALTWGMVYRKSSSNRKITATIEQNKQELLELSRIDQTIETIEKFNGNNKFVLDVLKEITQTIPPGVYIKQFDYDLAGNTIQILGRADSFGNASKTVSLLGKCRYFADVKSKGSFSVKNGDKNLVDFEIVCAIKRGNDEK